MNTMIRLPGVILAAGALAVGAPAGAADAPAIPVGQPATPATIAAQRTAAAALPAENQDAEFAGRGFLGTRSDPLIRTADGRPVWNLDAYAFAKGPAPLTVNPSLWRHAGILAKHGLFKVADGVWQVRGFDVSNMTVIAGRTGWILVDPLTTRETGAAALALVNQLLGARPVRAVIYSHSHADHFGGVRGVVEEAEVAAGKVAIIAPAHFAEEAASENVMAGAAMGRRAMYQFGAGLVPGAEGQMTSGIGLAVAAGTSTLIAPTDTIAATGETREVDGVKLEFQMASGSEAPSEMNVYIAGARTFLAAEMATCTLHNILTPRGAKVRDARLWAGYLDEAATRYAPQSDTLIASHCWPRFGHDEVGRFLRSQRDNYRFLHDQTVRRMNRGETPAELAEALAPPPALAADWATHGYYGTYNHDAKAIYQFYLGWYDAVPANLNPWPPVERAKRYVAAMGGTAKVLAEGRRAFATGDYRWSSEVLQHLVFADPTNKDAREALARSYEQQGYQAESAIWRNQFLVAARELRMPARPKSTLTQSADLIAAVSTHDLLDSVATRFAPERFGNGHVAIDLVLTDRNEHASLETGTGTLIGRTTPAGTADVTITAPRRLVLTLLFLKPPLASLEAAGMKVTGNRAALESVLASIDPLPEPFAIVEP